MASLALSLDYSHVLRWATLVTLPRAASQR